MPTTLSHIGEFRLIDYIRKHVSKARGVIKGIGDDAAVLDVGAGDWLLLTTDMLIEGVHFDKRSDPQAVGRKSLACNISDIAAMGGLPTYGVIALGAPAGMELNKIKNIFKGINTMARKYSIGIVGGDTVKSERLVINIALLGRVQKDCLVTRAGARPGDRILVTGPLGKSLATGRHLSFEPRLKESQYLVKHFKPGAMIDISDGLAADLGHILKESRTGAEIVERRIPLNAKARINDALYDGEDFELVFTLASREAEKLKGLRKCPFIFYEIGKITKQKFTLKMFNQKGRKQKIEVKGFEHF